MKMNDPKSMAFRTLVRSELINQFSDKLGFYLNPSYVIDRMNNSQFVQEELGHIIPPQMVDSFGGINQKMLRQYLHYYGISNDVFERQIERALLEKIGMDLIKTSFYLPEFDVKQRYISEHARKNFSILELSKDKLVADQKKKKVSNQDLATFFETQNKQLNRYWVPEKRSGKMWTFEPKNYRIVVTDNQIDQYYEKNKVKEFINQPTTVQVRRILIKVPNESKRAHVQDRMGRMRDDILPDPSKFAEFAQKYSEDKESAEKGGLLEPFGRGKHEEIFDKTAFLIKSDGEISSVIETSQGYEMLQRVMKKGQTFKPFSSVKGEIKKELTQKQFDKLFVQDMKKVIDQDKAAGANESLLAFIKEKGGKPVDIKEHVLDETAVAQHLFGIKKPLETSFFVDDDKGVALELSEVKERYLPSLESMQSVVLDDYAHHQAQEQLNKKLSGAKSDLANNKSFKDLETLYSGELIQTGWLEASKPESSESFQKKGVPVSQMLQLEKTGAVLTHVANDAGFIIRLDEISPFSKEDFDQKRGEITQALEQERLGQYLEGFVASLHRNAKIETNESVVTLQE